jgi:rfaE bifunctional protein kinase chain/domain
MEKGGNTGEIDIGSTKIVALSQLSECATTLRAQGKTVALCHGTFDLLHIGHIRHISRASQIADAVIVTVTADAYVSKGPGRPVFNERLRAEQIAALQGVTFVAINFAITGVNVIEIVKPDFYVKGSDYKNPEDDVTGNISVEEHSVRNIGGSVVFTDELTFSSSKLLNENFEVLPPQTRSFLNEFKKHHRFEEISGAIKSAADTKVLVLGDAIIDEYNYARALGHSGKYNVLSAQHVSSEKFAGGALAVANHIASVTSCVTIATGIGSYDSDEAFITEKLNRDISKKFFRFSNAPTIKKARYLDDDGNRFFEIYHYESNPVCDRFESEICDWLQKNLKDFDLVVIPDFGNGLITPSMIDICCAEAKKLALNTQVNSGNRGFHEIGKYPRADFICLNEAELRLAAKDNTNRLEPIAKNIAIKQAASFLAVTRGTKGILVYESARDEFFSIPALSSKVIDRVGAGDAFLAYVAVLLAAESDGVVAGFVGAAAAALGVQIVCNREAVELPALLPYLNTLLK